MQQAYDHQYSQKLAAIWKRPRTPNSNRPETDCNTADARIPLRPPVREAWSLYLDEMAVFLWDEFQTLVTTSSIRRALVTKGWSKTTARQRAREQMPICETIICILSRTFNCITWFTLMNLDVTKGLGLDGQVGHYLARPLCK
jgi:hypothetical protein